MELDFSTLYEELNEYEDTFKDIVLETFKHLKLKCDPIISVSFVSNETIKEINSTYRHIDKETDVISFAFIDSYENGVNLLKKPNPVNLGEIYISYPKAIEQAKEYGHSLHREICFLFTHGLLHLLGYDHMLEEDEKVMFSLQELILKMKGVLR